MREDILAAVEGADRVLLGRESELLAVRMSGDQRRAIVVVYREVSADDGFVITAFATTKMEWLSRRTQVWPPSSGNN